MIRLYLVFICLGHTAVNGQTTDSSVPLGGLDHGHPHADPGGVPDLDAVLGTGPAGAPTNLVSDTRSDGLAAGAGAATGAGAAGGVPDLNTILRTESSGGAARGFVRRRTGAGVGAPAGRGLGPEPRLPGPGARLSQTTLTDRGAGRMDLRFPAGGGGRIPGIDGRMPGGVGVGGDAGLPGGAGSLRLPSGSLPSRGITGAGSIGTGIVSDLSLGAGLRPGVRGLPMDTGIRRVDLPGGPRFGGGGAAPPIGVPGRIAPGRDPRFGPARLDMAGARIGMMDPRARGMITMRGARPALGDGTMIRGDIRPSFLVGATSAARPGMVGRTESTLGLRTTGLSDRGLGPVFGPGVIESGVGPLVRIDPMTGRRLDFVGRRGVRDLGLPGAGSASIDRSGGLDFTGGAVVRPFDGGLARVGDLRGPAGGGRLIDTGFRTLDGRIIDSRSLGMSGEIVRPGGIRGADLRPLDPRSGIMNSRIVGGGTGAAMRGADMGSTSITDGATGVASGSGPSVPTGAGASGGNVSSSAGEAIGIPGPGADMAGPAGVVRPSRDLRGSAVVFGPRAPGLTSRRELLPAAPYFTDYRGVSYPTISSPMFMSGTSMYPFGAPTGFRTAPPMYPPSFGSPIYPSPYLPMYGSF